METAIDQTQNQTVSTIKWTIDWLTEQGLSALPVAPAQDPYQYHKILTGKGGAKYCPLTENFKPQPLFTGKNPSYLDCDGKPHLLSHKTYQDRLPTQSEKQLWWENPLNGIGSLGSDWMLWIDIDAKNFESQAECDRQFNDLLNANPELKSAPIQRTHSGGYRVGIKIGKPLGFTNFRLSENGPHVGEILGKGRFAVLAPTMGPSGNPYQSLNESDSFPLVDSLKFIYPYSKSKAKPSSSPKQPGIKYDYSTFTDGANLVDCLSPTAKAIYQNGDTKGDRSDSLTTLAKECFGWGNWLAQNNISFTPDPYQLIQSVGAEMGIDGDRIERIINTISIPDCIPACQANGGGDSCWLKVNKLLGVRNSFKNYKQGDRRSSKAPKASGDGDRKTPTKVGKSEIRNALMNLVDKDLSEADLVGNLTLIASRAKRPVREIQELYDLLHSEVEREESRDDFQKELEQIISASNQSINLLNILCPEIAEPILAFARYLNVRPEVLLTAFLCGISAIHKKDSKVKVNNNWDISPNLFGATVAPSSQSKTPINRAMIGNPMKTLQWDADQEYEHKLREYKRESQEYQSLKGDRRAEAFPDGEPEAPRRRAYSTTDTTMEGLSRQSEAQDHGVLINSDELAGFLAGQNQYKGGGGNDAQQTLELYDSGPKSITRKKEGTVIVETLVAIYGGFQNQVLGDYLAKSNGDANGTFARFLMVEQPFAKMRLNPNGGDIDISGALIPIYQAIADQPATTYRLEHKAYVALCLSNDKWEDLRGENIQHPISNFYGKARGRAVKLAINIHCINYAAQGVAIPFTISEQTMKAAIALTDFYNAQALSLYARLMGDTQSLPANLAKVISLAQGRDDRTVTARDVSNRARITKDSKGAIALFKELEKMGFGALVKYRKSYKFVVSAAIDNSIDTKNSIDTTIDTVLTQKGNNLNPSNINTLEDIGNPIDTIDTKIFTSDSHNNRPQSKTNDPPKTQTKNSLECVNSVNTSETLTEQGESSCQFSVNSVSIDQKSVSIEKNGVSNGAIADSPPEPDAIDWTELKKMLDGHIQRLGWNKDETRAQVVDWLKLPSPPKNIKYLTDDQIFQVVEKMAQIPDYPRTDAESGPGAEPRAILKTIKAAKSPDDLEQRLKGYTPDSVEWVWQNYLTQSAKSGLPDSSIAFLQSLKTASQSDRGGVI